MNSSDAYICLQYYIYNCSAQVLKEVLEETGVGRVELSFSYDPQSSILKVGIHQAVILKPPSKGSPNPYVTGYVYKSSNWANMFAWNVNG